MLQSGPKSSRPQNGPCTHRISITWPYPESETPELVPSNVLTSLPRWSWSVSKLQTHCHKHRLSVGGHPTDWQTAGVQCGCTSSGLESLLWVQGFQPSQLTFLPDPISSGWWGSGITVGSSVWGLFHFPTATPGLDLEATIRKSTRILHFSTPDAWRKVLSILVVDIYSVCPEHSFSILSETESSPSPLSPHKSQDPGIISSGLVYVALMSESENFCKSCEQRLALSCWASGHLWGKNGSIWLTTIKLPSWEGRAEGWRKTKSQQYLS